MIWIVLLLFCISNHASWRDEYHTWLIATRAPSLSEFFRAVQYDRSPPLLYLLQRWADPFFNKIFSSITLRMRIVPTLFAVGSAALLFFKYEKPNWMRRMLPFGVVFFREYSLISRSYSLGVFFLLLGIVFKKKEKVPLFWFCLLLSGTSHSLFTLLAGMMFVVDLKDAWREKRFMKPFVLSAFIITALGFLSLVLFLYRAPLNSVFDGHHREFSWDFFYNGLENMSFGLMGIDSLMFSSSLDRTSGISYLFVLPLLGYFFWLSRSKNFPWLTFLIICVPGALLGGNVYGGELRHAGVALIGLFCVSQLYWKLISTAILVIPAVQIFSLIFWIIHWNPLFKLSNYDFSDSRNASHFLRAYVEPQNTIFVSSSVNKVGFIYFPLMAELGLSIFDVERGKIMSYPYFQSTQKPHFLKDWCIDQKRGEIGSKLPYHRIWIGLWKHEKPLPQECRFATKIYETTRTIANEENYLIYEIINKR